MNGYPADKKYIDMIDVSSAEYLRPADIRQDVRQMSERKRVNEILKSRQFREDLEKVVVDKINTSPQDKASMKVLQNSSGLPPSQARLKHGPIFAREADDTGISDGVEGPLKTVACKLACSVRILNQPSCLISVKTHKDNFLVSNNTLPPSQMCASGLVRMDDEGVVTGGRGGDDYVLISTTYQARPDAVSVVLLTSPGAVQVSEISLLPLSRQAVLVGSVVEVVLNDESTIMQQLQQQFVAPAKVGLLKGQGFLVVGGSIEEGVVTARRLVQAINIQVKATHVGLENVEMMSEAAQKRVLKTISDKKDQMEFEGLLRKLEHQGHHTGLPLKEVCRVERCHVDSEVELPPTVVALGMPSDQQRAPCTNQNIFAEYLNSPMAYKKQQVDMAPGTPYHKTIIKWLAEDGPSGTSIKFDHANQFVPLNTDPAELKQAVKMIRKEYYDEKITSGPGSKILDGPSWEEAQDLLESNRAQDTVVTVGAASRGIIQKGHQNQGTLYSTYYAPNPFDNVTPEQVEAYQAEIDRKTPGSKSHYLEENSGNGGSLEAGPDGELVSTEERLQQFKQLQETDAVEAAKEDTSFQQHHQQQQQQYKQILQKAPIQQPPQQFETTQLYQQQPPLKNVQSPVSPCKSVSSGEGNEVLSANENGGMEDGDKKKKKKRGFKMPSFSKKKK